MTRRLSKKETIDYFSWKKLKKRLLWFDENEYAPFQLYVISIKPNDKNILNHSNKFHLISNQIRKDEELRESWGYSQMISLRYSALLTEPMQLMSYRTIERR